VVLVPGPCSVYSLFPAPYPRRISVNATSCSLGLAFNEHPATVPPLEMLPYRSPDSLPFAMKQFICHCRQTGFQTETYPSTQLFLVRRIIFHQHRIRCFRGKRILWGISTFQRPSQACEVTPEPKQSATSRNVAAIVARLILPTIEPLGLDYGTVPAALKAKLFGYLQGFCLPICAAWHVDDPDVPIAATRGVIALVFPENTASFSKLMDGAMACSDAFRNGIDAGRRDGELYSSTGRRGSALLQILESDFQEFYNDSEFAANQ
jgi:hypothetical protein